MSGLRFGRLHLILRIGICMGEHVLAELQNLVYLGKTDCVGQELEFVLALR